MPIRVRMKATTMATTSANDTNFNRVTDDDLELLADSASRLVDLIESSGIVIPKETFIRLCMLETATTDELTRRGLLSENELIEEDVDLVYIPDNFDNPEPLSAKSAFADFVNSLDLDDFEDDGNE